MTDELNNLDESAGDGAGDRLEGLLRRWGAAEALREVAVPPAPVTSGGRRRLRPWQRVSLAAGVGLLLAAAAAYLAEGLQTDRPAPSTRPADRTKIAAGQPGGGKAPTTQPAPGGSKQPAAQVAVGDGREGAADAQQRNRELTTQIDTLRRALDETRTARDRLEERAEAGERQVAFDRKMIQDLEQSLRGSEDSARKAAADLKDAQAERKTLVQRLAAAEAASKPPATQTRPAAPAGDTGEMEELKRALDDQKRQTARLREELTEARRPAKPSNDQRDLAELQRVLEEQTRQAQRLRAELAAVTDASYAAAVAGAATSRPAVVAAVPAGGVQAGGVAEFYWDETRRVLLEIAGVRQGGLADWQAVVKRLTLAKRLGEVGRKSEGGLKALLGQARGAVERLESLDGQDVKAVAEFRHAVDGQQLLGRIDRELASRDLDSAARAVLVETRLVLSGL